MDELPSFLRYVCIGVINTTLHAAVFFCLIQADVADQSLANLCGFLLAATFSYMANARWTFRSQLSFRRYLLFTSFLALLAFGLGKVAQPLGWPPFYTFCLFSGLSLILGYTFARILVFGGQGR